MLQRASGHQRVAATVKLSSNSLAVVWSPSVQEVKKFEITYRIGRVLEFSVVLVWKHS